MKYKINIVFLFLFPLRCITEQEKELVEKLKSFKHEKILLRNDDLNSKLYVVQLFNSEDVRKIPSEKYAKFYRKYDFSSIYLFSNDMFGLDKLIEDIKGKNKNSNIVIRFNSNIETQELYKYIRIFIQKLEENKIENVVIKYFHCGSIKFYYAQPCVYIEFFNDNFTVLEVVEDNKDAYLQKRKISNKFLTELMKYNAELYCNDIHDIKKKELFEKYFINYKLLLIKKDLLINEGTLLNDFSVDKVNYEFKNNEIEGKNLGDIPDMKYLNSLFYFLKDSDVLKNIIKKSFSNYKSCNYSLLKEILENLEITIFDGYQFSSECPGSFHIPDINNLNDYPRLVDDICNKIAMLEVKKDVKNYKIFLIYLYYFLKDNEDVEVDELIKITEELIVKSDHKEWIKRTSKILASYLTSNADLTHENVKYCLESDEILRKFHPVECLN